MTKVLASRKSIPYAVLATLHYIKASAASALKIPIVLEFQDDDLKVGSKSYSASVSVDGSVAYGIPAACRVLSKLYENEVNLYGTDPSACASVDYWIDYATSKLDSSDYKQLARAFSILDHHLKLRTFFVGYSITLADLVIWGALRSSGIWVRICKTGGKELPINLHRWYNHLMSLKFVANVQNDVTKVNQDKAPKSEDPNYDIDLPGVEVGKICTRFPPEPSGYLHIGHAKAALLNQYFAQRYKGKLIIRFDDTNPSKEKVEFEESILEDLKLLEIHGDSLSWTSDYFDQMYEFALKMIKTGKAYVDDTPLEEMRAQRMEGIASRNRDVSVEVNLRRFEDMKNATEGGLKCCLRAKISVDAKNKALRDPVIYRCNLLPHNRTGDKWKIYPTYDFACPIVDSMEGVTHALRTTEYHDRNDQYYWMIDALGLRKPHIWDFSRVNFVYTLLSKRKLQWFVDQKKVPGWDDPRFPTVKGIIRRGLTVEGLKKYILMQGPSKNTILLTWDKLWALNKQILDPICPRFVALNTKDICRVIIEGALSEEKEIPKHKKNASLGFKKTLYSDSILLDYDDASTLADGEEVTLMDWGNVIINSVKKNEQNKVVSISAKLHLEGDFKKTKKKLTWLAENQNNVPVVLHDYDFLITKKKLEEEDTFEDCLNPETEFLTEAIGDLNIRNLKKGDFIQLERRGYFICDRPLGIDGKVHLILIPDGKASSTELKNKNIAVGK